MQTSGDEKKLQLVMANEPVLLLLAFLPTEQKSTSTLTPARLVVVGEQCRLELTRWGGEGRVMGQKLTRSACD